jgi:hypothetical protein
MTAPERLHRTVAVHPGSDLAVKDTNVGWQKIHRVQHWMRLSAGEWSYNAACGLRIETKDAAADLSSGQILGVRCNCCWRHLPTTTEEALRQAALNDLLTMLGRLQAVTDTAAHYVRDVWSTIAELELGCHCEEVAHTLCLSAEHWFKDAA